MALILSGDTGPSFVQSAAMPTGSVIQTVNSYNNTGYTLSLTANTWTDTAFTATITPQATANKILVLASINGQSLYNQNPNSPVSFRITRNGTAITDKFGFHTAPANGENQNSNDFVTFLDSPSSTSAVVYTIQIFTPTTGTNYVNRTYSNTGGCSVLTLQEIKG